MAPYNPPQKATIADSLWYLDYYQVPPHLKPPPRLSTLPSELLAVICHFTTTRDLCQLALVSRRLRDIAQNALIKPAKLPRQAIRKFVETMVDRPDMASILTAVDLGDFGCGEHGVQLGEFDTEVLLKCEKLVTQVAGAEQWSKLVKAKEDERDDQWGSYSSFCLAVLSIIAPNLKILSVEPRPLGNLQSDVLIDSPNDFLWELQSLSPMFGASVSQLLQLEELTISTKNSCFKGIHMRNISLVEFTKLKRLSLPIKALIRQNFDVTSPEAALPPNLEQLEIRSCDMFALQYIAKLATALGENLFPKLRVLNLYFEHCLRSSLILMTHGQDESMFGIRTVIRTMRTVHDCKVTAYTRSRSSGAHEANDPLTELDAFMFLSQAEAWMAATKEEQFTTTVARGAEGTPRARTPLERKILLRNSHVSTTLLSSPTFDVKAWEKVWFFRGTKGTKAEFDKKDKDKGKGRKEGKTARSPGHQDKRRGPTKV